MIDYSYLSPPAKVKHIRFQKNYIYQNVQGRHTRRIFCQSHYQLFESEAIDKIKKHLKSRAPNIEYPDELLLRLSYLGSFEFPKIIDKVSVYDEWHQNEVITTLHQHGRQILQHGHIYAYGRDYDYCPVIIVKWSQFDFKKYQMNDYLNSVANLLDPLQEFMLVGGIIQKWNVLVDLGRKAISFNRELLFTFVCRITAAYPYRLKRLLLINLHDKNRGHVKQLSEYLHDIDSEIGIEIIGDAQALDRFISNDEREKKYSGNLLNLCEYWPIHTTNKYQESLSATSKTQYQSAMNDPIYFEDKKAAICDSCKNCSNCNIY